MPGIQAASAFRDITLPAVKHWLRGDEFNTVDKEPDATARLFVARNLVLTQFVKCCLDLGKPARVDSRRVVCTQQVLDLIFETR